MMCPACGNRDFAGIDTEKVFTCPVAGCGLKIDPEHPAFVRIRAELPAGSFFAQFAEREGEDSHDP